MIQLHYEGLAVGAGVETEDTAYTSAGLTGTLPFYPAQSYDIEGNEVLKFIK